MVSPVTLAVAALTTAYFVNYYLKLRTNIAAAKQSGLPYVIVPIFTFNRFWLITHRLWLRLLKQLPNSWTEDWIPYAVSSGFERVGRVVY